MRILGAAVAAVLVATMLSGCAQPAGPAEQAPGPSPTTTPLFASEEDALAAAEEAYAAYLAMSDLIASEGGINPERMAAVVTEEWLERELDSFENLRATRNRLVGRTAVSKLQVQSFSDAGDVGIYVCGDYSSVRLIDSAGADITPVGRADEFSSTATFQWRGGALRIAQVAPWSGASLC